MNLLSMPIMLQAIISAALIIAVLVVFLLRFARGRLWVGLAVGIALADQISKFIVLHYLRNGRPVSVPGLGQLVYFENRLLGFGETDPALLAATVACVAVLIVLYLRLAKRRYRMGSALEIACALIIGGCLGILIDRASRGYVIDWLDFGPRSEYVYNIADLAVIAAAAVLIAHVVRTVARRARPGAAAPSPRPAANPSPQPEAEAAGRAAARMLRGHLGDRAAAEIAASLGLKIEEAASPPPGYDSLRVRSEYRRHGATIVLYKEPLRTLRSLIAVKRPQWRDLDLEAMHILHEIYHHIDAQSGASPASEEASHFFVAEMLGLDFSPRELDQLYADTES